MPTKQPSFKLAGKLLIALFFFAMASLQAGAKTQTFFHTEANVMVELTFSASQTYQDPFNEVTLDVIFIEPSGRELRVPAFWDGTNVWKARYASPIIGRHVFRTECSITGDKGLNGIKGKVEIKPYHGTNALYLHGPLRVSENRRFLEHHDGTPFFWFADTWWTGLSHRLHWPEDVKKLGADRKEKGFNVIQIVAGLNPDMFPFDPRGANEGGYPWETNYTSINPRFFDAADLRFKYMADEGFVPCIVGAWGYYMPWMGVDKMKMHWRYLIARYGALPVVWCSAGEANLPWYLVKNFPYDDRKQIHDWTEVMRYIRATDPYHRLLTVHPTGLGRLSARNATDDPDLIDIDALQTPHGQRDAVAPTVNTVRESYADHPVMPVIDTECSFENLGGTIPAEWTRQMFWLCMMNGAAGHTYGANGIWQVNRRNDPHGKSPHGGDYGHIPWDDAMNLPGSIQESYGKKLLLQYPWQNFQPHPEWAAFATETSLSLKGANWIWFPEGDPSKDAPAEKRYFRRTFVVPEGGTIKSARLHVLADDRFEARINGTLIGNGENWQIGKQFNNVAVNIKPGTNVLAIIGENMPANSLNPAGVNAALEITFPDGKTLKIISDANWKSAKSGTAGWDTTGFDESAWTNALVIGKYGDNPWIPIMDQTFDGVYGPQSAGIPGVVRMIYVPVNQDIIVRNLGAHAQYSAYYFDPVTGVKTAMGSIRSSETGSWICQPPTGVSHDWVLILEEKKQHAATDTKHHFSLANESLRWDVDWNDDRVASSSFENRVSGHRFEISDANELVLNFSGALDRVTPPFLRVDDFKLAAAHQLDSHHAVFELSSALLAIEVKLHFQVDGQTRRKWAEVKNKSGKELLLLDAELDNFTCDGRTTGGGPGQPVFIEDECFAAIEHPSGMNNGSQGHIQLLHHPGIRLAPGASWTSQVALVSVASVGKVHDHFLNYVQARSRRGEKAISIYTPFGINNQWGACPTLDDEETLDVLNQLERWQKRGMHFDYFTLDTGWVDPNSPLTRFRPTCYPEGPQKIIDRVNALGMQFGLWFPTSWASESCWDYPPALAGQPPISMPYRLGYPDKAHEGRMYCLAEPDFFNMVSNAVIHAIMDYKVHFIKLDGGSYLCDRTDHHHLPGVYATEQMHNELISIANAARKITPDVRFMLYYGCYSPFWALHGDFIFEAGVPMEGSATSKFPTLGYRDSVTLMQDEVAQYARNIPPLIKDSLGVWLADNKWGNFMGKEAWRNSLVMDLGRGNLLFPNIWGDLYLLNDGDVDFLAGITKLAKQNEALFAHRHKIVGDPWFDEAYGYAYGAEKHGFVFLNNANFTARHVEVTLDSSIGLNATTGSSINVISHYPGRTKLLRPDGDGFKTGDVVSLWLRPFEVLMLEVTPSSKGIADLPNRSITFADAAELGVQLPLKKVSLDPHLDVSFADAARFQQKGFAKQSYSFETTLPVFTDDKTSEFAVTIQLRQGNKDWTYAPTVCDIAQALVNIDGQDVQLIPLPDGRQDGNTQSYGSSWVTYKVRLGHHWSGKKLKLSVHAYLPTGVEAHIETYVIKHWWNENRRPAGDGYYNDAFS